MGDHAVANLFLSVLVRVTPLVHHLFGPLPGPESSNPGMKSGFRSVKRNTRLISLIARASGQIKLPGAAFGNSSEDKQRLVEEKVWRPLGIHLRHLDAFKRQFDIGQHRALNAGKEPSHLLTNFTYVGDVGESSSSELRHLGGEEKIRRATDGNRVQARIAQIAAQSCENFVFVAEIAVG